MRRALVLFAVILGLSGACAGRELLVTSTADSGPGTLRWALESVRSGDVITFDQITFPPASPATIFLNSELPPIARPTERITIDASNAGVIIDGSNVPGDWDNGIQVYADHNTVMGLQIVNFAGSGISVCSASYNRIGGDRSVGAGPVGQGNRSSLNGIGIDICDVGTSYNVIQGNLVGTDVAGTGPAGNRLWGIWVEDGAHHNTIGPDNTVAFNTGHGIEVTGSRAIANQISKNSIHSNLGDGIRLAQNGNESLPSPIITSLDPVRGTLAGTACPGCTIEVFSDDGPQGRAYEGTVVVDDLGGFDFSKAGQFGSPYVTTTATNSIGSTSSFSAAQTLISMSAESPPTEQEAVPEDAASGAAETEDAPVDGPKTVAAEPGERDMTDDVPAQTSPPCHCCDDGAISLLRSAGDSPRRVDNLRYEEDFEDGYAQGWSIHGSWSVVGDPDEGYLFQGIENSLATYIDEMWYDFSLTLRVRLLQGGLNLWFRKNGRASYILGLTENNLDFMRTHPLDGERWLPPVRMPLRNGDWHEITIVANKESIDIYANGRHAVTYADRDPLAFGMISLAPHSDSEVQIDDVAVVNLSPEPSAPQWEAASGPRGGLGYDIRVSPGEPCLWYVTDAKAGLHVSLDGGYTWARLGSGITARGSTNNIIPVFSLTIDPHDPSILWAGIQWSGGRLGDSIYKSTDWGLTWHTKTNGIVEEFGISFRGFTVDPRSSDIVYAAAEISSAAWTEDGESRIGKFFDMVKGVVYKTEDGGDSWHEIWRGNNLARYVLINPNNPDTLYVSTGIFDRDAADYNLATGERGGVGILKSTDGGETWTVLGQANGLNELYVGSLFMHPEDPNILIAGAHAMDSLETVHGAYLSEDGGDTWSRVVADDITAVEFATADPRIVYAASAHNFYRSEDGGHSWEQLGLGAQQDWRWGPPGIEPGVPIDMQVDPRDPNRVFVNSYAGGNVLSEDGGRTWRDASQGYTGCDVFKIVADPVDPRLLYAAGLSGVFSSTDAGATWEGLSYYPAQGGQGRQLAVDPFEPQNLLYATLGGTLFSSTDGGLSWRLALEVNISTLDAMNGIYGITFSPSDPGVVYAGTCFHCADLSYEECFGNGIVKSLDSGKSWRPANDASTEGKSFYAFAVDPRSSDVVYAASRCDGLFKTLDGGENWEKVEGPGHCSRVSVISIVPTDPDTVYVGTPGCGLHKSTDGGMTWRSLNAGLIPEARIADLLIDPADPAVLYLADFDSGVYRSADGGETWRQLNRGLLNRSVRTLALSADGTFLYAGTNGGGVFRLDLEEMDGLDPAASPNDRDGDTVPDNEDYCPDYPGNPGMNGC